MEKIRNSLYKNRQISYDESNLSDLLYNRHFSHICSFTCFGLIFSQATKAGEGWRLLILRFSEGTAFGEESSKLDTQAGQLYRTVREMATTVCYLYESNPRKMKKHGKNPGKESLVSSALRILSHRENCSRLFRFEREPVHSLCMSLVSLLFNPLCE